MSARTTDKTIEIEQERAKLIAHLEDCIEMAKAAERWAYLGVLDDDKHTLSACSVINLGSSNALVNADLLKHGLYDQMLLEPGRNEARWRGE